MLGKTRVKLILLMTAVNLVFSCLVTNCPRGGKRGNADIQVPSNNVVVSRIKRCNLCNPGKEVCLGVYCSSEISCGNEGNCVTQELCCSKKLYIWKPKIRNTIKRPFGAGVVGSILPLILKSFSVAHKIVHAVRSEYILTVL